jgi:hypothetical protein
MLVDYFSLSKGVIIKTVRIHFDEEFLLFVYWSQFSLVASLLLSQYANRQTIETTYRHRQNCGNSKLKLNFTLSKNESTCFIPDLHKRLFYLTRDFPSYLLPFRKRKVYLAASLLTAEECYLSSSLDIAPYHLRSY